MATRYLTEDLALRRGLAVASVAILVTLTGCASDGSLTLSDSGTGAGSGAGVGIGHGPGPGTGTNPEGPTAGVLDPVNGVIPLTGSSISTLGGAVSTLGTQLAGSLPGPLNTPLTQGVGGALGKVGDSVDSLGTGVRNGLGQLGRINNPVGVTAGSLEGVVTNAGQAVGLIGAGISAGVPPLAIGGNLVSQTGEGVTQLGSGLGNIMNTPVVQQVTRTSSQVVVPITTGLLQTSQQLGHASGLGQPAQSLLTSVGGVVGQLGEKVADDGKTPMASPVGQIVSNTGASVALVGGTLVLPAGTPAPGVAGLGGLLPPASGLLTGLGQGGNVTSPLAPLTGITGSLAGAGSAPLGGVLVGATGGAAGAHAATGKLLAPVTGVVAGLTGGAVGGATGGNSAPGLLTPVTGLLGQLTGALKK